MTVTVVRGRCPAGVDAVVSAATAEALTELFVRVRDELVATADGGGVLVVVQTEEPCADGTVRAAVGALVRSLAREYADRRCRVNVVLVGAADVSAMEDFLTSPAAVMLTGAVLDAR
ncbi:MAG: SDR family oxidoreductase [Streptosporangiales bacterium]|nr:SDR family oxidoreductase [Streptosporangiales bacterium]